MHAQAIYGQINHGGCTECTVNHTSVKAPGCAQEPPQVAVPVLHPQQSQQDDNPGPHRQQVPGEGCLAMGCYASWKAAHHCYQSKAGCRLARLQRHKGEQRSRSSSSHRTLRAILDKLTSICWCFMHQKICVILIHSKLYDSTYFALCIPRSFGLSCVTEDLPWQ